MLLTLKVSEGLQGLQAITWSGLWESTHIPEAELVLPPSSGEWKQPLGRVNLLSPTLSPHHIANQGYGDWSWWIAPQKNQRFLTLRIFGCLQKTSEKGLYICISSGRSECKDGGTVALQEKARFPILCEEHSNSRHWRCRLLLNNALWKHNYYYWTHNFALLYFF